MIVNREYLLPHERAALIEALRRDSQSEQSKASCNPEWAAYHWQNVRMNIRILEAFDYRQDRFETFGAAE